MTSNEARENRHECGTGTVAINPEGLILRPAQPADWNGIWEIFRPVVSKGDTYSRVDWRAQRSAMCTPPFVVTTRTSGPPDPSWVDMR